MTLKVFIIHAKEDVDFAKKLRSDLKNRNIEAFLAPYDIEPGKSVWSEALRALEGSSAVIALISRHYFTANAREEVGYAFKIAQQRNIRILPVIIDPACVNPIRLPAMISHLRAINFVQDPYQALQELRKCLDDLKTSQEMKQLLFGVGLALLSLLLLLKSNNH